MVWNLYVPLLQKNFIINNKKNFPSTHVDV